MAHYVTLPFNKKMNLLRAHSVGCEWPNLDQEQWCQHCGKKFNGHSVRVRQDSAGALWLECGTTGCDGSPIDWAPKPWWNPSSAKKNTRKKKGASKPLPKKRKSPSRRKSPPAPEKDDGTL